MIQQRAFAKINIGLRILRRREDGYHDIETILHRVNISDEVTVEKSDTLDVDCSDPGIRGEKNLCFRAAKLIAEKFNMSPGAKIFIQKHIPVGAGLGGGSSDAATTLILLNKLWNTGLTGNDLHDIALRLGSDVPFFLGTHSAHATSRGEVIRFFPLSLPYAVLVVFPGMGISTATAYAGVTPVRRDNTDDLRSVVQRHLHEPARLRDLIENDFEPSLFRSYPEIAAIKSELLSAGADLSLLSGSGSSVFAFFPDESRAQDARKRFPERYRTYLTAAGFTPGPIAGAGRTDGLIEK